jgi:hypothetical protein
MFPYTAFTCRSYGAWDNYLQQRYTLVAPMALFRVFERSVTRHSSCKILANPIQKTSASSWAKRLLQGPKSPLAPR